MREGFKGEMNNGILLRFQDTLEHLEECSSNAVSQSEQNIPAACLPAPLPANSRTERPVWSAPRRYPRSPSPLSHPLTQTFPGPLQRPLRSPARSPARSPGSSPRSFSPIGKMRPSAGDPAGHLSVEADYPDPCDQVQSPPQQ